VGQGFAPTSRECNGRRTQECTMMNLTRLDTSCLIHLSLVPVFYMIRPLLLFAICPALIHADDGPLIASFDDLRTFNAPKDKARSESVDGKVGKAICFTFGKDARSVFFTSRLRGNAEWDKAAGLSFWVKGDGTDGFGGLQLIFNEDYAVRYDVAFPVVGTEWKKIVVAWRDFVPVLPGAKSNPLDTAGLNKPSQVSALWVGKWWYWGDYPAVSFALDEMRLEPTIEIDTKDYKPVGPPLARVQEKLKAGKPITIVTMGDSLTDTRHWANRTTNWPTLFKTTVKEKYKADVTVVNPAIGGTQLRQNLVLMPRWLQQSPEPDLVTVFFGGNDWEAGMRGAQFQQTVTDAIDRIRRSTRGKADVLILTTNPTVAGWDTLAELAEACRKAATDRNAGLADTFAGFHAADKDNKERLYVNDKVHLGLTGHELVAEAVLKAIEAGRK
jgi:lysophospholipase L1-like esterase